MADWRPDGCIWIEILALCMSASGRESTSSGRLHQSSLIWTWKENLKLIDHWTSSGRAAETSGRMQAGIEASRYSDGFGRKCTSSRRMMLGLSGVQTVWHVVRTDGTVDRWASGRDGTIIQTADKELEIFWLASSAESSETLQNSRIPCKTASLHTSDFVQTKWGQSQTNRKFQSKIQLNHCYLESATSTLY
jgi:hypothetical protein